MQNKYFITATGTDIGKTYFTCKIIQELISNNKQVKVLKPVISGYDFKNKENDLFYILKAMGLEYTQQNIEQISLYRLKQAQSPDIAASYENVNLEFRDIVKFCSLPCSAEYLLIEGAGGVMVPITKNQTYLDLIKALNMQVILLTGSYLGAISHTLTAYNCMVNSGVKVNQIVINETENSSVKTNDMQQSLKKFVNCDINILLKNQDIINFLEKD